MTEVTAFLQSCGEPYDTISGTTALLLLDCIVSNMYFVKRDNQNRIVTALFWWKVHPEDVATVTRHEVPTDHYNGSVLFLMECGNKADRKAAIEAVRAAKSSGPYSGVFCHRNGRGFTFKMQQKGG